MQTFGDYLKKQREDRKVSLREVARLTNITERYLDFIEKDDYAKIPEGPYIRGYISSMPIRLTQVASLGYDPTYVRIPPDSFGISTFIP